VVAYSVVRSRVDGEKIPRWPYDTLYELVPELTSELFARTTAYFQAPPQAWDLDRLITTYSGEFVGHVGGSGPWEFRLLSHGEVAMRIAKQSQKFGHLTKDHIRKRYAEIKRAQQALRRKWAGAISWMPGFALDSNGGWLKLHEAGLREFIEQHGAKLNKP
jgi:hypothetical protein